MRTLLTIANGSVTFASRNGLSYDAYFPELKDLPAPLALSTGVADEEVVALDSSGKIRFQAIQPWLAEALLERAETGRMVFRFTFSIFFLRTGRIYENCRCGSAERC